MEVVKKGTKEWQSLQDNSINYRERLDYEQIKLGLEGADADDFIVINRPHSHRSNLVDGLSRQGLNLKEDYKLSLAKTSDDERILIIKLAKEDKPA